MAIRNGQPAATAGAHEESPLLRNETESSTETLTRHADHDELHDGDKANQQVGQGRGLLIVLSLWGLIFLQASNMSAITTIQSRIAEDLDAYASATWFTSTYLIAVSSIAPISARLAQIFSPRACIFAGAVFFSIGGVVTSQAYGLPVFLLGRAISGIGGANIMTISFILVLELSGKKKRGLFIGLVNTGFTTGISLGAVVAGALLPVTGWRFWFLIQGPLGLLAGVGIFFSIPKEFTSGQKGNEGTILAKLSKIDYFGALTLMATVICFLFGLSWPQVLWLPIGISFVLLAIFVTAELYVASDPIIPVTVLKSRGALLSCLAQLGIMAARWMVLYYTPTYAIAVRGWSPASAGAVLVPTNLGLAIGGVLAGWLHIKRTGSFWSASVITYFLFACTMLLLSQISNPDTPASIYILSVFLCGLAVGASLNYTLAHLLHLTPSSTHFISTSLLMTFRGFAGSFGTAIGGGLFVRTLKSGLDTGFAENGGLEGREDLVRRLLGSPALVKSLTGLEKMVAVRSYVGSLGRLFLTGAGLALLMVFVQAGTGWKSGAAKEELVNREVGDGTEAEDESWEEGMEQGV